MTTVRFKQVDVFTVTPFRGNPVAVVLDSLHLDSEQMQRIAAWTNLSETTFVLPSASADFRLRIFTPRAELPFAGHPTIGSAHAVLEAGIVKPKAGRFRQECAAGIIELSSAAGLVWLKAPPVTLIPVSESGISRLGKLLGARVSGKPLIVNVGPVWLIADLGNARAISDLKPDMRGISHLSEELAVTGITVFGASGETDSAIHVRSFAPAHGIAEDPVCGSGNVSVAHYLLRSGQISKYGRQYVARQGMQLGRDGRVSMRVEAGEVFLGGRSVTCVEGSLRLE